MVKFSYIIDIGILTKRNLTSLSNRNYQGRKTYMDYFNQSLLKLNVVSKSVYIF